jgi:APA family basic amino acid/polyamine antiporter
VYIFVLSIFFGMNSAALFILRRRFPNANRPYRVWGYPYVPALFLFVTIYLLINTFLATPIQAIGGIGLVMLGLPLYEYFNRRNVEKESLDWLQGDE